jgi:hypothetical protein
VEGLPDIQRVRIGAIPVQRPPGQTPIYYTFWLRCDFSCETCMNEMAAMAAPSILVAQNNTPSSVEGGVMAYFATSCWPNAAHRPDAATAADAGHPCDGHAAQRGARPARTLSSTGRRWPTDSVRTCWRSTRRRSGCFTSWTGR